MLGLRDSEIEEAHDVEEDRQRDQEDHPSEEARTVCVARWALVKAEQARDDKQRAPRDEEESASSTGTAAGWSGPGTP